MATTTPKGFPKPQPTDDDKPRLDLGALADFLEAIPGVRSVTTAERNSMTVLWPGMAIFNSTLGKLQLNRSGTAGDWVSLFTSEAPLPVANGGTGLDVAPSLLVNLESTTAASPLTSDPRPGIVGKLPIANGGTGRDQAPSLLVNLESTAAASPLAATPRPGVTGVLPLARGGNGSADVVTPTGVTFESAMGDVTVTQGTIRRFGRIVSFSVLASVTGGTWAKGAELNPFQIVGAPLPAMTSPVSAKSNGGFIDGGYITIDGLVVLSVASTFSVGTIRITGMYLTGD